MKDISEQRAIYREIKKKSHVKGFPDKTLVLTMDSIGMSLREKSQRKEIRMSWEQWIEWMFFHGK